MSTLTPPQLLRRSEGTNRRKKGAEKKIYSKAADNLQFTNIVSMNLRVINLKCQMTKIRNPSGHKIAVLQRDEVSGPSSAPLQGSGQTSS